jgi:hypothetical protein
VFIAPVSIDAAIFVTAAGFTGPVGDERSLAQWREAIRTRGSRGVATLRARSDQLRLDSPPTAQQALEAIFVWRSIALLEMYDGKLAEAVPWLERALDLCRTPGVAPDYRAKLRALLGIAALRRGEVENCIACLGPSSCIFPIAREAVHTNPAGSREAVRQFSVYLEEWPGDLRVRWLLNVAYMTLGEYPEKVPAKYLIPLDHFRSKVDVGRFENVAPLVGLTSRGPGQAGGSIFDDFNGDGRPDVLTTSIDPDEGATLFVNRGDGTFEDRSEAAGLSSQVYALNAARADFDNDGNLDVVLLRGGWERPGPLSLLRNKGNGVFEDVTESAGLGEPIATESAAWGDYDNDGLVDLFVCGEYQSISDGTSPAPASPDARNRCRLYHNLGGGKFADVAARAGVENEHVAKGVAWGDFDDDGRPDLFVSNMHGPVPARLYHNEGDGTFRDIAAEAGITGSPASFACLAWDYDNDGRLDLFVCDYKATLPEVVASYLGLPVDPALCPRLYRNVGGGRFREVGQQAGLNRPIPAMGMSCGDIDNDGYLDLHLGTGWMSYSGLVPNVMLKNMGGTRFEDVTESSGTGHLQKGHGVSFADYDGDGALDLFVITAGGYPGDKGYSALFRNPGGRGHWLKVTLVGTKTNRAALGARVRAEVKGPDGSKRSVHRLIGTTGSFGGNSLVETIGLGDARSVERLVVTWPTSGTMQTFENVAAGQSIEVTEGSSSFKVLHVPPLPSPKRRAAATAPGSRLGP